MSLLLHKQTRQALEKLNADLPQSLLLIGQKGTGLCTLGLSIADKNLIAELYPLDSKGTVNNESGLISVEMIRGLYDTTRARREKRAVVLIDNADRMSAGAQAAFLKLLEEPSPNIHFILTSHAPQKLLPTVRSRVEELIVHPVSQTETKEFIASLGVTDAKKQTQLLFIASGLPAEITRVAKDDEYFMKRARVVGQARDFLQHDPYKKMLLIQEYKNDRDSAISLIDSCIFILRRTLSAKPQQAIISQLELLLYIRENISANYNISLQLARFAM